MEAIVRKGFFLRTSSYKWRSWFNAIARDQSSTYLYNTDDVEIRAIDNRRYTMRDIGNLEDRIENLERFV